MEDFKIGQKLNKSNRTSGAIWCNENGCVINPETWVIEEPAKPTQEELAERKRADRDRLLQDSDIRMLPDFPISAEEKELWLLYRQYLRDITKDPAFPNVDVLSFENWLGQIHSKEPVLGVK